MESSLTSNDSGSGGATVVDVLVVERAVVGMYENEKADRVGGPGNTI